MPVPRRNRDIPVCSKQQLRNLAEESAGYSTAKPGGDSLGLDGNLSPVPQCLHQRPADHWLVIND